VIEQAGADVELGNTGPFLVAEDMHAVFDAVCRGHALVMLKGVNGDIHASIGLGHGHVAHERFNTTGSRWVVFTKMDDAKRVGHVQTLNRRQFFSGAVKGLKQNHACRKPGQAQLFYKIKPALTKLYHQILAELPVIFDYS
jgi:hypothetical protein